MSTSSIDDGQAIASQTDAAAELLTRYLAQDWPFHSLGETIVSVRHDNLNVYSDELAEYYLEQVYRSPTTEPLRPHPYQLATMAYLHLRRLGEDQSILLDGVRGSGKTEMYWEMFHQLSRAAGASHEPIAQHLQRVLSSFGTGMQGESKHGIYQELQFSTRGKLQGVKTLSFYLDLHSGPSTFQVMRQFKEGVTDDERHRYQLEAVPASTEFSELMESLKQLGVKAKSRTKMRQVMGSMLLLMKAKFEADSEGATCHDLDEPAIYLGLTPDALLSHLNERTITVGREKCSQLLTAEQAQNQLNEFLGFMYNLLYQHVLEKVNLKLCSDDDPSFIAMVDFPGLDPLAAAGGLGTFARNYTAEMIHGHIMAHLTDADHLLSEMEQDGLEGGYVPKVPTLLPVLRGNVTSLLTTLDLESNGCLPTSLGKNLSNQPGFRMDPTNGGNRFILTHYAGEVAYSLNGFQDTNRKAMAGSWAQLLATSHELFVSDLVHALVAPASDSKADIRRSVLIRHPSMKHCESLPKPIAQPTILNQLDGLLGEILSTLSMTRQWVALCLNPNADPTVQVQGLHLAELESRVGTSFTQSQNRHDFLERYHSAIPPDGHLETSLEHLGLEAGKDFVLGTTRVYLTPRGFMLLEGMRRNPDRSVPSGFSEASPPPPDDDEGGFEKEKKPSKVVESASRVTKARKAWVRLTWMMTWWIPDWCIIRCGRMTRPDVQMAWREKVTICLLIFWSWFIILFVNIGLGLILCPANKVWKPSEITTLQGPTDLGVYMYGNVYDITQFAQHRHGKSINPAGVDPETMLQFGGLDVTSTFPVPLTASCPGLVTDPNFKLWVNISDDTLSSNLFIHDSGPLTQYPATSLKDSNWFFSNALPQLKSMKKGEVVYDFADLTAYRKAGYKQWGAINNRVYDLTAYVQTLQQPQFQVNVPGVANPAFLPNTVLQMFSNNSPAPDADLTSLWNKRSGLSPSERASVLRCLDRTFFVGTVDLRKTMRCQVTNVMLLVSSGMILLVTLVKFLAALQLTSRRSPTDYDKFVICQVPCYTEGEESVRRTLESLALLNYDDKHKLIFVIADGMIIGSGNDRPTPRIVLDVLGVDPALDPEPFAFRSIGEGNKQLNYGKIYSGLFGVDGRSVPYIVAVKVGKPGEGGRPGNRGKRDSQILLMNFLNRVHFDAPMAPLDLEIYHQLKNVIGVDPKLYEYILMVDADTEVMSDALTRLVAVMTRDAKVIGLCGETQLSNENQSITTMMQVYEYYISHHLAKAFESLFGAVTCLPGCFCMYRIRTLQGRPLIISNSVIQEYSENVVDTLHKKNLLHLGEDRYLTTLILKHFPSYKMKFTPDAQCKTVAPDQFAVLLSQRRRWINSTIHNLFELIFLNEMCGFCCFSMRFVVFLDLIGTLILPATVIYLVYIIVAASTGFQYISTISVIIMCSTYILQALIFILKQQWQHVGWMVFYLLGMGLFNFYIPIYSYWHFDDFSWGNTRVVVGEDGVRQIIAANETEIEPFDPSTIPMVRWSEHQSTVWETVSNSPPPFGSYSRLPSPFQSVSSHPIAASQLTLPHSQTRLVSPTQIDDQQLYASIQTILYNSDLMTLTKKQIRQTLAGIYPTINWEAERARVNQFVDTILAHQQ